VAHDFNNLLMAVLGNLGLARRRLATGAGVTRHSTPRRRRRSAARR
jgi:hypothetical protein